MSFIKDNNKKCSISDCNKKIKLTHYSCKCGEFFCKIHIFQTNHLCNYDYKENNKKENAIKKLECKSIKIDKI